MALGEIDTATAPAFNADLHDTIDRSDEAFVSVDCSGVTFMDSAGYHVLVDATDYAVRRGHTLVIRNWGERSFYCLDPDGNRLCFVEETPLFLGRGAASS